MSPRSVKSGALHLLAYIFKGGLVQEFNSLAAKNRLLDFPDLLFLFLFLFRRFLDGGGTSLNHPGSEVFDDRGRKSLGRLYAPGFSCIHSDYTG